MKALTRKQANITLASVFTLAGVVYCLISLVNHYFFKTYALDLGLYTHAMYEYAHFRMPDCGMFKPDAPNILSDHFDLYLVLLSPLVYVFGTYTLLIVQIAAVLLGGWGIHKLIGLYTDDVRLPILATTAFFFSFGIIHPLTFDYHSNVLTAMMFPWLLYFIKQRKFALASLFVVLFVIGKENMSLWLFFIALGLMWDYRKDKRTLWYLTAYAVFSIVYFVVINMVVMPKLGGSGGGFVRYAYLGDNYADIAKNLLTHPIEAVRILFINTTGKPHYDGIKTEFYLCALATGMIFTLLKPNYFLMLLPLIGQKMLASDRLFWGVSLQYSVEFMPVLIISSFLLIIKLKSRIWRQALALALLVSTVLTTFYTIGVPRSYVILDQTCIYQGRHYRQKGFDVHYAHELVKQIPADASVSAATTFVPHLALRKNVYEFVSVGDKVDADYIFIHVDYLEYKKWGRPIFNRPDDYELVASDGTLLLYRKKGL